MEPDEFSLKLTSLTIEANKEFIKCSDLRAFLDEHADLLEKTHHTLAYGIARSIVNNIAGLQFRDDLKGYGSAEIVHREYKNLLANLTGDDENPVIKLLAQRAAICWLHVQQAERFHARIHDQSSIRHQDMELADKHLTMAQNRFLRACDALTRTRAMILATEAMQEKIGKRPKPQLALVSEQ